jgi:hypothetical protein
MAGGWGIKQRVNLVLIANVLRARGYEVELVAEAESSMPVPVPMFPVAAIEQHYEKIDLYDYRRERDYPTLKEGLRNRSIKSRKQRSR